MSRRGHGNRASRSRAYGRRQHEVAEVTRSYQRAHPGDCSVDLPYEHAMGAPGCVVIVAPPTALELRAIDGDR